MALIALIGYIDRSTLATGTYACAWDLGTVNTGAGGTGFGAAVDLPPVLVTPIDSPSAIRRGSQGSAASEGSNEILSVDLDLYSLGGDMAADLRGVEIEGQPFELYEIGTIGGVAYTCVSPLTRKIGVIGQGSWIKKRTGHLEVYAAPTGMREPMLRLYEGWGPALLFPAGGTARATWEVWDPAGDMACAVRAMHAGEDWKTGTQILAGNGDIEISVVASKVTATVALSGTDASVTSTLLPRPEAFYVSLLEYTHSTTTVQLTIWQTGVAGEVVEVYQGSHAGSGTRTTSGNTWVIGADVAETGSYLHTVGLHDVQFWSTLPTAAEIRRLSSGPILGTESGLYAWLEGEMLRAAEGTLDNAAAVDYGSNVAGLPSTGHGFVAGQEATVAGSTNWDGAHVLLAGTTANEMRVAYTVFNAETFAGTETVNGLSLIYDKAAKNAGARRDALPKGVRPGTSLSGGVAATESGVVPSTDGRQGAKKDRHLGPVKHIQLYAVRSDPDEAYVVLGGDELEGVQDFRRLYQGGIEVSIESYVTTWLALFAAAATVSTGEAVAYPAATAALLDVRTEGAVSADVAGEGMGTRGLYFDGVTSYVDLGTANNSMFNSDWSVRGVVGVITITGESIIVSNDEYSSNGFRITVSVNSSGQRVIAARAVHASVIASVFRVDKVGSADIDAFEFVLTETFEVDGSDTDFTLSLYIDGVLEDTDTGTVATASMAASIVKLMIGARHSPGPIYSQFFHGQIAELSIMSAAETALWAEQKFLDDIAPPVEAGSAAVDLGGGLVGIDVYRHPFSAGESIKYKGTANYTGTYTTHADTTRTRLVFSAFHVIETFDGTEFAYPSTLAHHYPSRINRALPAGTLHPASTLADEIASLDGTITGAEWRGPVGVTSPRAMAVYLDLDAGRAGAQRDLDLTADWPVYPLAWSSMTRSDNPNRLQILNDVVLASFDGWYRYDPDGTLVLGWIEAPEDQAPDVALVRADFGGTATGAEYQDDWDASPPRTMTADYQVLGFTEAAGELLAGAPDGERWADPVQQVTIEVPNAATLFPYPKSELDRELGGHWATRAGAQTEGDRQAAIEQHRRATVSLQLKGSLHLNGAIVAGNYVSVAHPEADAAIVYGVALSVGRKLGDDRHPVAVVLGRVKVS